MLELHVGNVTTYLWAILFSVLLVEPWATASPVSLTNQDAVAAGGDSVVSCSADQLAETPCRCCKMTCWYAIAKSATHELGHVPGQAGEEEALATLRLIRACMIQECSEVCTRPRIPFLRPMAMSSE